MPPQAKGAAAHVAAEALAVEEVALRAQSLHHVHPLATKMAGVAAAEAGNRVLTHHALEERKNTGFSLRSTELQPEGHDVHQTPAASPQRPAEYYTNVTHLHRCD